MQLVITLPSHLEQWLREKFREEVSPEEIVLAALQDAYEDDRHGEDDA